MLDRRNSRGAGGRPGAAEMALRGCRHDANLGMLCEGKVEFCAACSK